MKEIKINLYNFEELAEKAQERALNDWNKDNDDPLMQSHMINLLKEKLEEKGIKHDTDSVDVRYSLSNCQGDGFMFIGSYTFKGRPVKIEHRDPHYYHMYTADMTWTEGTDDKTAKEFLTLYQSICKEMERAGYDHIEYITSREAFIETCEANEYTFEEDGRMRNK